MALIKTQLGWIEVICGSMFSGKSEELIRRLRRAEIAGQVVIVIDDGIATGATTRAALQAIRNRKPKELVLAVPVAPPDTIRELRQEVDALICLETPELFGAIGYFYRDFRQVSDEEVVAILKRFPITGTASITCPCRKPNRADN